MSEYPPFHKDRKDAGKVKFVQPKKVGEAGITKERNDG
jgi:hypothetical protein